MAFPDLRSKRSALTIVVLVAIAALPLAASRPPDALPEFGLSLFMILLGCLLWWLPTLGSRWKLGAIVLPAFMTLTGLYLCIIIIAFANAPKAVILIIVAQLIALIYVSFRA